MGVWGGVPCLRGGGSVRLVALGSERDRPLCCQKTQPITGRTLSAPGAVGGRHLLCARCEEGPPRSRQCTFLLVSGVSWPC